jgi:hypothetical protein
MGFERSLDDIYREFLRLEVELDLFALRIDGIPIWERIRRDVFEAVLDGVLTDGDPGGSPSVGLGSRLRRMATAASVRNPFLRRQHDTIVWGHNRREQQPDGTYWDLYCDPLYEALNLEYLHLEVPHKGRHYRPAKTESLAYLDAIRFVGTRLGNTRLGQVTLPAAQLETLQQASETIENTYGLAIDVPAQARQHLRDRKTLKPLLGALLDIQDPSLAVVVVSYEKEVFIEACRERSIPVVELQHGVVHRYNLGYSYPGDRTKENFPDHLLTFGEYWTDSVEFPDDATISAVGYPYMELTLAQYPPQDTRDAIVFISQNHDTSKRLARMAHSLATMTGDWTVRYKLHPEEYSNWESRYPWLVDSPVSVVGRAGPSLYELFANARAQVGVGSTALFEGLRYTLQTFVVPEAGYELLGHLLETEITTVIESVEEIATQLRTDTDLLIDTNRFFKPDPIANIDAEFERIRDRT